MNEIVATQQVKIKFVFPFRLLFHNSKPEKNQSKKKETWLPKMECFFFRKEKSIWKSEKRFSERERIMVDQATIIIIIQPTMMMID